MRTYEKEVKGGRGRGRMILNKGLKKFILVMIFGLW
jgi:hypothetical protein